MLKDRHTTFTAVNYFYFLNAKFCMSYVLEILKVNRDL